MTGRHKSRNRGEKNPMAKLTDEQVRNIYHYFHVALMTQRDLARLYDVSPWAIYYALNHRAPALGLMRDPAASPPSVGSPGPAAPAAE